MEKDITPELLETIQKEFNTKFEKSSIVKSKLLALKDKKATHLDSNEFAIELGTILSKSLMNNIEKDKLPDGKMYFNIANRVIKPNMKRNFDIIGDYSKDVQDELNKQSKISLKAIKPKMNEEKIDNLVSKISDYEDFDKAKWLLNEPIINFSQSIVDDTVKENAEFQYKSGLTPVIVRKMHGECCDWCAKVVGTYKYPDEVPPDIYKRHRYCRCTVEYLPGDGRKQNVHTKKWNEIGKDEEIEARKTFANTEKTHEKFPKELAGTKRGNMMDFEEADGAKPNPKFDDDYTYKINCQTCVVAYEARRRGYDVEALGNFEGSLSEMLSRATNKAWIDPKTGTFPDYIKLGFDSDIDTPSKYFEYLKETLKDKTRYTMEFAWKGRGNGGHIVHIFREGEAVKIYDPQTGSTCEDVKKYLNNVRFKKTILGMKVTTAPQLLEVENYDFNLDVVNKILVKSGS